MPRKKINKEISSPQNESPEPSPRSAPGPKKVRVHVENPVRRKLIDEEVLRRSSRGISRTLAIAAALGFLLGGGVAGYLYFSQEPVADESAPREIVLPEYEGYEGQEKATSTPARPEPAPTPKVEILTTPIGYLNVRRGPGTNFEKIGEIKPGEVYDLVSEDPKAGWYEIKLSGGTGWVTKQYARVK